MLQCMEYMPRPVSSLNSSIAVAVAIQFNRGICNRVSSHKFAAMNSYEGRTR